MTTSFCQFWLTCADAREADKISSTLLFRRFIACAKQIPLKADYWKGQVERSEEVLLVMESRPEFFQQVETEVAKLHSYDTFVLEMIPITQISDKAKGWLDGELSNGKK